MLARAEVYKLPPKLHPIYAAFVLEMWDEFDEDEIALRNLEACNEMERRITS